MTIGLLITLTLQGLTIWSLELGLCKFRTFYIFNFFSGMDFLYCTPPGWQCIKISTCTIRSPVAVWGVPSRLSDWELCHGSPDTHVLLRHRPANPPEPIKPQLPPLRTANLGSRSGSACFPEQLWNTDGSGCATARDRTRVREAPPALPVFVTKPQNRLNSDNPPEGGLLGKRTASHGTSRVKDSEIKAIMGGDCAERKRTVTMHRENIFLVLGRLENMGEPACGMFTKAAAEKAGDILMMAWWQTAPHCPERRIGGGWQGGGGVGGDPTGGCPIDQTELPCLPGSHPGKVCSSHLTIYSHP